MFKINFDSVYRLDDGYGNAGENILLALDEHPEVEIFTNKNWKFSAGVEEGLFKRTVELCQRGFKNSADYSIRFSQPDSFKNTPSCRRKRIGWSMWEYTKIPNAWKKGLNSVPVRFVCCKHNQQIWTEGGAKSPTYIVPLGIDPKVFYYREDGTFEYEQGRKNLDKFTFILAGTICERKNPGLIYKVFNKLFADKKDVRLIMKAPQRMALRFKPTHNIQIINATWWRFRMADLLREGDCLVYPTQGEGFGLCPIEAMAVGNTVICTDWSGPADYLDESYAYKLRYSLNGSVGSHWGDTFGFALPDEEHFKELMWHVYTHQDEAREKGRLAAKFVAENLTRKHTADRIVHILKELE